MHVAGVSADPATFEHIEPEVVGNRREMLISELSGKGTVQSRAATPGIELDDDAAARVVERVKELEHRGYHYEAADGSFELLLRKETGEYEPLFRLESWRAIVEKRADGRVETEATIKIWVGGERYVRTAEGNGPVQRAGPRAARGAGRDPPPPARHRAGQLQGPDPRRDQGHRRGHAGAARRLRRRSRVGLDRRLGERDRGLLGGARRLARVRDAAERGGALARRREPPSRARDRGPPGADPARPAGPRARGGGARAGGAALRPAVARPGACPSSSGRSPPRLGAAHAIAVSSGTGGPAPGAARRRASATATRWSRPRSRSWPAPTSILYERATPVFADIDPVTLNLDPAAAAAAVTDAHRRAAAGARVRLPGRHAGARGARAADRRGRLRGARRRCTPTAARWARAGTRRCSASTPTSS